jgi:hypothetical protein
MWVDNLPVAYFLGTVLEIEQGKYLVRSAMTSEQ